MSRRVIATIVSISVACLFVVVGTAAVVLNVWAGGEALESGTDCGGADTTAVSADTGPVDGLSPTAMNNAATIIAVGKRLSVPPRGWVVAIAAARQESGVLNLASSANPASLGYPHDSVAAGDHDSVGIFQQRDGWGSMAQRMNVGEAAKMFFTGGQAGQRGLLDVIGWQSLSIAQAAQAVQVSAFPTAYAQWEGLANSVVEKLSTGTSPLDMLDTVDAADVASCTGAAVAAGTVVYPLPAGSGYTDQHNYGNGGSHWAHGHTGTDLSVACGTPVLAATGGTIQIDTTASWAGRWLVKVSTGAGKLTTWYAHMRALSVTAGQAVQPGQQIGEVGDLGNATGCHLHFEVHPKGGSIYEDGVDPSAWLAANVGKNLGGTTPISVGADGLTLATFNTLGASHTGGKGKAPGMASGPVRVGGIIILLGQYHVDVAGLQEFQRSQEQAFRKRAGSTYGIWYPGHDTENAVVWRKSTYTLVGTDTLTIPYFNGRAKRMPIVQLRNRATGETALFFNTHNPADTRQFPRQQRWRDEAVRRENEMIAGLVSKYQMPVFATGDMNDHERFFCPFTASGTMVAAAGGINAAGHCAPPAAKVARIDWIMGRKGTAFTGYTVDQSALVKRTSDHPFVVTQVPSK